MGLVHMPSTPWISSWCHQADVSLALSYPPHPVCFLECSRQRPYHRHVCILRTFWWCAQHALVLQHVSLINGQSQMEAMWNSKVGGYPKIQPASQFLLNLLTNQRNIKVLREDFEGLEYTCLEGATFILWMLPPPRWRGVECQLLHL